MITVCHREERKPVEHFKMRFFRKLQITSVKQQETSKRECLSNGTIKPLEISEGKLDSRGIPKEEETGKTNEGFELIEEEREVEKSATGDSNVKESKEASKEAAEEPEESKLKIGVSQNGRRCSTRGNANDKIRVCLDRPNLVRWATLGLIGLATWSIVYFIAGSNFLPGSQLFSLTALFALAYVGGACIKLMRLPSLLGMLLVGLLLRNVHFIHLKGVYMEVAAFLREVALCIILIRAGLGLDPKALRSLKFVILRLASIPGIVEGMITMTVSHFILGFPWLWGLLLGAILAAVSPAVVIPCLFSLQEKGYGTGKGIPTLVVAAASLDDILAITVFGVVLNLIYTTGASVTMQVVQGPLGIVLGIAFGIVWGFVARFVPHRRDSQVVLLRVLIIIGGGLMAIVGSGALGCQGAGPLGCIIAAFVARLGWRKENQSDGRGQISAFSSHPEDHPWGGLRSTSRPGHFAPQVHPDGGSSSRDRAPNKDSERPPGAIACFMGSCYVPTGTALLLNPVAEVFRVIWLVFQPILFGLIGSEVDISVLDPSVIGNGFIALVSSLLGRIVVTVFVAFGAGFNWKEKTFIAWAWFPKATVQAALGPLALDLARRQGSEEDIIHARKILVLAVLAILITAPTGAILIRTLGPKLLAKDDGRQPHEQKHLDEVSLESRDENNKT